MTLVTLHNNKPNPLVILADAMDAIQNHGYDSVVVIVMKPDGDLVNWSQMTTSHLAYAAAILNKAVIDNL